MIARLIGAGGLLALCAFLLASFGSARRQQGVAEERAVWLQRAADAAVADGAARVQDEKRLTSAISTWANRALARDPIILTNTREVTRYAQTPAGHVACRTADRVLLVDQLDARLFPIAPGADRTDQRAPALPSDAPTPPAGR